MFKKKKKIQNHKNQNIMEHCKKNLSSTNVECLTRNAWDSDSDETKDERKSSKNSWDCSPKSQDKTQHEEDEYDLDKLLQEFESIKDSEFEEETVEDIKLDIDKCSVGNLDPKIETEIKCYGKVNKSSSQTSVKSSNTIWKLPLTVRSTGSDTSSNMKFTDRSRKKKQLSILTSSVESISLNEPIKLLEKNSKTEYSELKTLTHIANNDNRYRNDFECHVVNVNHPVLSNNSSSDDVSNGNSSGLNDNCKKLQTKTFTNLEENQVLNKPADSWVLLDEEGNSLTVTAGEVNILLGGQSTESVLRDKKRHTLHNLPKPKGVFSEIRNLSPIVRESLHLLQQQLQQEQQNDEDDGGAARGEEEGRNTSNLHNLERKHGNILLYITSDENLTPLVSFIHIDSTLIQTWRNAKDSESFLNASEDNMSNESSSHHYAIFENNENNRTGEQGTSSSSADDAIFLQTEMNHYRVLLSESEKLLEEEKFLNSELLCEIKNIQETSVANSSLADSAVVNNVATQTESREMIAGVEENSGIQDFVEEKKSMDFLSARNSRSSCSVDDDLQQTNEEIMRLRKRIQVLEDENEVLKMLVESKKSDNINSIESNKGDEDESAEEDDKEENFGESLPLTEEEDETSREVSIADVDNQHFMTNSNKQPVKSQHIESKERQKYSKKIVNEKILLERNQKLLKKLLEEIKINQKKLQENEMCWRYSTKEKSEVDFINFVTEELISRRKRSLEQEKQAKMMKEKFLKTEIELNILKEKQENEKRFLEVKKDEDMSRSYYRLLAENTGLEERLKNVKLERDSSINVQIMQKDELEKLKRESKEVDKLVEQRNYENKTLQSQNGELTKKLNNVVDKMEFLRNENTDLVNRMKEYENNKRVMEIKLNDHDLELSGVKTNLEIAKSELKKLVKLNLEGKSKFANLKKEWNELINEKDQYVAALKLLESNFLKINETKKHLEMKLENALSLQKNHEDIVAEKEELLMRSREKIERQKNKIMNLEHVNVMSRKEIEIKESKIILAEQELANNKEICECLSKKLDKTRENYEKILKIEKEKCSSLENSLKEKNLIKEENLKIKCELKMAMESKNQIMTSNQKYAQRVEELEGSLSKVLQDIEKIEEENKSRIKQYEELKIECNRRTSIIHDLERLRVETKQNTDVIVLNLKNENKCYKKLSQENSVLNKKINNYMREQSEIAKEIENYKIKIEKLVKENENLKLEAENFKKRKHNGCSRSRGSDATIFDLERENSRLQKQVSELENKIRLYEVRINMLNENLAYCGKNLCFGKVNDGLLEEIKAKVLEFEVKVKYLEQTLVEKENEIARLTRQKCSTVSKETGSDGSEEEKRNFKKSLESLNTLLQKLTWENLELKSVLNNGGDVAQLDESKNKFVEGLLQRNVKNCDEITNTLKESLNVNLIQFRKNERNKIEDDKNVNSRGDVEEQIIQMERRSERYEREIQELRKNGLKLRKKEGKMMKMMTELEGERCKKSLQLTKLMGEIKSSSNLIEYVKELLIWVRRMIENALLNNNIDENLARQLIKKLDKMKTFGSEEMSTANLIDYNDSEINK